MQARQPLDVISPKSCRHYAPPIEFTHLLEWITEEEYITPICVHYTISGITWPRSM